MSEPTREEKLRTIQTARQVMKNLMEQHAAEFLIECIETQREFHTLARGERPQRQQEPQEDPQEQARLHALLANVQNSGEAK